MSKNKIRKSPQRTQNEANLLRELALDFDWGSAAKRAGIAPRQLDYLLQDEKFAARGQAIIDKAMGDRSGVEDAIKKFRRTQELLLAELEGGDMSISSAVLKSHEMEFKMHGLFEKDNTQKGSNVSINITFDNPNSRIDVEDIDHDG